MSITTLMMSGRIETLEAERDALRERLAEAVKILEGHWCTKGADTNVECDVCAFLAKEEQEKQ